MTLGEMLSYLRSREVKLWVQGDKLCYSGPAEALTDAVLAELKDRKAEIVKVLNSARSPASPVSRAARHGPIPLSFTQERQWFLDRLEPGSPLYNIPVSLMLKGPVNRKALQASLDAIVARHENLRTNIITVEGKPAAIVGESRPVELRCVDLRHRSESERGAENLRLLVGEARRPFDIETELMIRAMLVRLRDDEHALLMVLHHIAADGWSLNILAQEFCALYGDFCEGRPVSLPELSYQYADFAAWQRQWMQQEVLALHLSYWTQRLSGVPTLDLPTDRQRPARQTFRGGTRFFVISGALFEALKAFSRRERVSLFMTLMAAFQALLSRYTGQEDFAVGSPIANRTRSEFEELIGAFVNTLVFRADLSGDPTFRELLARVHKTALGAYENQDLPFERLVEELNPERNLSHSPLFQVMLIFQAVAKMVPEIGGLTATPFNLDNQTAKFDLTLSFIEQANLLEGAMEYNSDLFDPGTVDRMIGHYRTLLEGIVADPDQHISALPLLTQAERQHLLVECNDTGRDYPQDRCIHELFEDQVEKTPDAIALIFADQQLSYRELDDRANQLAHYLRKLGVAPNVLVGLCMERSIDMIVGILAILKAGGAYVPLDPAYPQERLAFMVEDSRAPVLITQSSLIERLPALNATVLCLDRDWGEISTQNEDNPPPLIIPEDLAYVIYTSGSTGMPKGALITHHNVVRLFRATDRWFHFSPDDVWTLFHSYAFDFSVWELWGALLHGGRLVVVPFEVSRSPWEFYELLCREQVTVLNQTPSAFRQLVQTEESILDRNRLALRVVIFGGEALDFQSLKPWFERHGDQSPRLINMYGITETTVHVTYRAVTQADLDSGVTNRIGVPVSDLELYVLDSYRNLVPIGVPGELYVGGAGLARGYLNRGELTAERFIDHPFAVGQGRKLYRSGDLVRRCADGDIEYLGRIDNQVKVRGFRIELGEIEATLGRQPGVRQAVVVVLGHQAEARLVAYVVPQEQANLQPAALRQALKSSLPDYMVPSVFLFVDTLPLTPNGKVDRRALPTPEQNRPELDEAFVAPRTLDEKAIADIWAQVLKLEQVGVHDNFFDLGGHSLLLAQVHGKLQRLLDRELPIVVLFQYPTISTLTEYLGQAEEDRVSPSLAAAAGNLRTGMSRLVQLNRLRRGATDAVHED